jgi:hypothetical protein
MKTEQTMIVDCTNAPIAKAGFIGAVLGGEPRRR